MKSSRMPQELKHSQSQDEAEGASAALVLLPNLAHWSINAVQPLAVVSVLR